MFCCVFKTRIFILINLLFGFIASTNSYAFQDISFYTPPSDTEPYPKSAHREVKNVIFFIGDGMGFNQMLSARLKAVGADRKLYVEKMPVQGVQYTFPELRLITDSASSATALATGYKTHNGMIAHSADGKSIPTLLEIARDNGKATGIVATSSITHATPASFAAHVRSRRNESLIAEHYLKTRPNVILGGGKKFFMPNTQHESGRPDEKDLIWEFQNAGYTYVDSREELLAAESEHVLGLFHLSGMSTHAPEPSLKEMTDKTLEILSKNNRGFFAVIEGSQIDWRSHDNKFEGTIRQMLLFDQAIKSGIDFAMRDGNTLVIVTADHETGGLMLKRGKQDGTDLDPSWAHGSHTPTPVPVFAFGPGAEDFYGFYDNTEIAKKIANLMKVRNFPRPKY